MTTSAREERGMTALNGNAALGWDHALTLLARLRGDALVALVTDRPAALVPRVREIVPEADVHVAAGLAATDWADLFDRPGLRVVIMSEADAKTVPRILLNKMIRLDA